MKIPLIHLAFLFLALTCASGAPSDARARKIEKEALTIARQLCVERYECSILIDSYDKAVDDPDPSGRFISFTALVVYIEQTLKPKLPENDATRASLARMHELFEERMAIE